MSLNNYSFQFGSFVFGGANSPFQVLSVDGLESLPLIRNQDDNRGYNDGMFTGRDFLAGRTLVFDCLILAGDGNSAHTNFNLFQAALVPQTSGTQTLSFQLSPSDPTYQFNARVRSRQSLVNVDYSYGYIKAQVSFFCPDPRYYSDTATTASMTPSATQGRTYDRTYDVTYGGGSLTNSVAIVNSGSWTTYPTITITGPVTAPTIGNATTGQYMTVNYTLTALDTVVIDLNEKLITLNGSSARNLVAGNSQWFGAPPGTSNFYFTGTGYSIGTTSAVVSYRSAWV